MLLTVKAIFGAGGSTGIGHALALGAVRRRAGDASGCVDARATLP